MQLTVILYIIPTIFLPFLLILLYNKYRFLDAYNQIFTRKIRNLNKLKTYIEDLEKKRPYSKDLLYMLIELNKILNNNQKILHYMQLLLEKDLLKEKFEIHNFQLQMASILFELNQTTEAFNKLISIKESGIYDPNWCILMGKIFFSQSYFEKARIYFYQATNIEDNNFEAKFLFYSTNAILLKPENSIYDFLSFSAFNKYYLSDIIISILYFSKRDFQKSYKFSCESIKKIPFDLFYKDYYILFALIIQELSKFYGEIEKNSNLKIYNIYMQNLLKSNISNYYKEKILILILSCSYIIEDKDSFLFYKKFLSNFNPKLAEINFNDYEKVAKEQFEKINNKTIISDLLLLSNKKPLNLKPAFIKMEFEKFFSKNEENIDREKLIREFIKLSKKSFINNSLKICNLFNYKIKFYRYFYKSKEKEKGINIICTKDYPYITREILCIRVFSNYKLDKKYLQYLYDLMNKYKAKKLIFICNFNYDQDFLNYSQNFPEIQLLDSTKLGYLLESIVKNKIK